MTLPIRSSFAPVSLLLLGFLPSIAGFAGGCSSAGGGAVPAATDGGAGRTSDGSASGSGGQSGAGASAGIEAGAGGGNGAGARWTCPPGPFASPFPQAATPTRIAGVPPIDAFNGNGSDFGVIEGPVWLDGALYVSEIGSATDVPPPARILKIGAGGEVTIAIGDAGSNGLAVGPGGQLLSANHKYGAITALSLPDGTPTQLVQTFMGARFDSPNDLTVRSDGTVYFTDPDYQAAAVRPQSATRVYRLPPGAATAVVVDDGRPEPNGITLSLDEKTLYVDGSDGLDAYVVNADGSVGARTVFAPSVGASDGMAIDCAGNLYIATNDSLAVVSPSGAPLGTITVPGGLQITNAAFGGDDHQTLYITTLGTGPQMGLFELRMPLPGMPY